MAENIFDLFMVVDEKVFTDLIIDGDYCIKHYDYNCNKCSSAHENKTNFVGLAPFASLEVILHNCNKNLKIKCIGNVSKPGVPLAQIVQWQWDGNEQQVIKASKMIKAGGIFQFDVDSLSSIVIRTLKKREKSAENRWCPPISWPDDQLTVLIGDKKFMEFVEAISITAFHKPILPNPQNVLILLKLADYFQVDWLKSRCEAHLINCAEIPMIDRFLLIDHYRLDNLKHYFLNLSVDKLRAFYKANRDQLSPGQSAVSDQLLGELVNKLCG